MTEKSLFLAVHRRNRVALSRIVGEFEIRSEYSVIPGRLVHASPEVGLERYTPNDIPLYEACRLVVLTSAMRSLPKDLFSPHQGSPT